MSALLGKTGNELTEAEFSQINRARVREFKAPLIAREKVDGSLFFLQAEGGEILAMGELFLIEPVVFDDERFSIMGIGGIVANEKGKGYGKKIMPAIKDHLLSCGITGVGFCEMHNRGFYEKCGFEVDTNLIRRFVFLEDGRRIVNMEDDCVLYLDGSDGFVEKVLNRPDEIVDLPRRPDW